MVIGSLDTGINFYHPSFAAVGGELMQAICQMVLRCRILGRPVDYFEWADIPHFGSTDSATFQIWILNGADFANSGAKERTVGVTNCE